jgi:hypothetical protein
MSVNEYGGESTEKSMSSSILISDGGKRRRNDSHYALVDGDHISGYLLIQIRVIRINKYWQCLINVHGYVAHLGEFSSNGCQRLGHGNWGEERGCFSLHKSFYWNVLRWIADLFCEKKVFREL